MYRYLKVSVVLLGLYSTSGFAQTTVTNANNGTTNAIPKYNGTASLTNSAITDSSGNIGIGNTSPAYKLDVSGDINVASGQAIRYNGTKVVTALPSLTSYFFGGAGNLTMTGAYNTAAGFFALASNTTGSNNAAMGESALQFNTTGYYNTAAGAGALYTNTTGHLNTATGEGASFANTTGSSNSAYGYGALSSITTGSGNVAIGNQAGQYIAASGANQTSANSLYIGYIASALADGDTNEIVIGNTAAGNGSNSVTLGNTSITKTVLRGNVGIGTASPNELLEVGSTGSTGGRMFVSNGGGASRKGLLFTSPTPSAAYSRIESYDYGASAGVPLVINNIGGGNVGIGTTSPGARLEVYGGIKMSSGSGGVITFADGTTQNTAAATGGGSYTFSTGLTNTSGTVKNNLSTGIAGGQTVYGGTTATDALVLQGTTGSGTSTAPAIKLNVGNAGATTALTVLNSGNVGIGTISPGQMLQVGSTYSQNPSIMIGGHDSNNSSTGNYSLLFGAFRDVETVSSGIVATPTWVCCGGYPASGYAGIRKNTLGFYTLYNPASPTTYAPEMLIDSTGYVGIGTSLPGEKLEVSGNLKLSGTGSHIHFVDGTDQSTAWTGTLTGGDYAESMDVTGDREQYQPGDVLVLDPAHPGHVLKSSEGYSLAVAGVYSTKPGVIGRRQKIARELATNEVPMAMVGVVPTKVTAENGAIKPGDVLVTSSKSGYAMKGTDRSLFAGAVIGKAMGSLDSGTGVIEALISLQ